MDLFRDSDVVNSLLKTNWGGGGGGGWGGGGKRQKAKFCKKAVIL